MLSHPLLVLIGSNMSKTANCSFMCKKLYPSANRYSIPAVKG